MQSQKTTYGWALVLERGEEVFGALREFAETRGVRAGTISAIGAVTDCELGCFVPADATYVRRRFQGEYEIGALTGNFSELDGRPFPHCHVVLGGADFVAYTGHLFRAVVQVTCEVNVVTDPGVIRRVQRPDLGFNPLALEPA